MLNQSKKLLCICVSFQESRDSIKGEPETNVYDMFLIILDVLWLKVQTCNSWNTKFWFKYPFELIWYNVIVQLLNC